ncbi:MAG: flagellar basal body P-ring formation chaperone FlgA [Gammaproteobacteria bacterium]
MRVYRSPLRTRLIALLAVAVFLPMPALAQQQAVQPLESVRAAAQQAAEQSMLAGIDAEAGASIVVGQLDPRLRLPACDTPLEGFLPGSMQGRSNVTVGVRCPGATPWTVYVPVRVSAPRPVVVLTRPVPRGAALTAQDIDVELREVGGLGSGYFEDPAAVLGKMLTRPGSPGQVVVPTLVTGAVAVKRGQQVTLTANSGGILVRMEGTALADGSIGDRLKVKNNSSARVVEGTVLSDGSVEIGL